jgi:hypothetical protein
MYQSISKKLVGGIVLVIVLVAGGLFWYGENKESVPVSSQNQEITSLVTSNANEVASTQATSISDQKTVWYDIPELGIRFPVSQEMKDELVYYKDPALHAINLSTRKLEVFSKSCSAREGAPLGGIARVFGSPSDSDAPCGGGQKVAEFKGGYFCYTHTQSVCSDTNEQYDAYVKMPTEKYDKLFTSEDFWKTVFVK